PGCNQAAVATLSYDYAERIAWIERLHVDAHPMNHDLCDQHAGGLRVPRGWRLEDRRVIEPLFRQAV
ncbi:MAG: DUF3499 family protein, partial [Nocardioidaceae bacterium]